MNPYNRKVMKSYRYILLALCSLLVLAGCQKTQFRTVYPAGDPQVTATMETTDVQYGRDSIYFSVQVTETETPLSTLTVKVLAGTTVIANEVVRTKDYAWEGSFCYAVPFGANMEEGAPVKVYLTATNVEGTTKDMILSSCIGHRPAMETMYIMPPTVQYAAIGKGKQMTTEDDLFVAYGLGYPKSIECLLAVVGNKFGRVDWNYPVFGMVGDDIQMITKEQFDSGEATSITLTDDNLETIDTILFNPITFELTFGGKIAQPVTTLDVLTDLEENPSYITSTSAQKLYRGAKVFFDKDSEVEITGCTNLATAYNLDWMEYLSGNKVKFLGEKNMYYVSYDVANDYIVIEPLYDVEKPSCMYLCGANLGQPNGADTVTSGWGFDSPNQNFVGRPTAAGVYQFTVFMNNTQSTDYLDYGTVNFKFFHKHGWGGEENGGEYTMTGLNIKGIGSEGITKDGTKGDGTSGNETGNWIATNEAFKGTYRITLDTNNKTTTYEKIK